MNTAAGLAVFAGLSFNLILQAGLALTAATGAPKARAALLLQSLILFAVVFVLSCAGLWLPLHFAGGFFEYALLFPLSGLACMGLESLAAKIFPRTLAGERPFSAASAYGGAGPVALFLTLQLAASPFDALVLSFSFAAGCFCSALLLGEIRRAAVIERLPRCMRSRPFMLISAGLLSLLCSAAAGVCFAVLG
ncbi:MAG: hypothetical protein LBR16_09445 [Treponema sp.]|jgi:hypothetical protein|nr:hypothetical protein [Treponema sp.]